MQPVTFISDIEHSRGAWGYSALVNTFFGNPPERKTLYFIRDEEGWTKTVLILDAKEAF